MPRSVELAIKVILFTLIFRFFTGVLGLANGSYTLGSFVVTQVISLILCFIPYKLSKASNAARYMFLILSLFTIIGVSSALAYQLMISVADKLDFIITIPLYIYSLYLLFANKESKLWFKKII